MKAIINGKIVTVTGETYECGNLLFDEGKIVAVGNVEVPEGAEIIDARGKWVVPGFIDAHTHISGGEPSTLPGISDTNEATAPITAHVRSLDRFNPADMGIEHVRAAGFTVCCTLPGSANLIGGTGLAFKTKVGRVAEDLVIPGTFQMKMALGENPRRVYSGKHVIPSTRMGNGAVLREALFNARVYAEAKAAGKDQKPDFKLEALVPVVTGEMTARIHCHRADDIVTAVRIAQEFGLRFSIEHATEGYMVADFLAENNVPCVVGPTFRGPMKMELWNTNALNPMLMDQAGVKVSLTEDAGSNTRLLPLYTGIQIAMGPSRDTAFRALTINPAELLGIADRVGSLEAGKDADIAIWNGDPFSNMSWCETTIVDGEVYEHPPVWKLKYYA